MCAGVVAVKNVACVRSAFVRVWVREARVRCKVAFVCAERGACEVEPEPALPMAGLRCAACRPRK